MRSLSVDSEDSGGDHRGMEARISALEAANLETRDRLARIETRLESVATKADLNAAIGEIEKSFAGVEKSFVGVERSFATMEKSLHALTWRIIGSCSLLVGASYFIAKNVQ